MPSEPVSPRSTSPGPTVEARQAVSLTQAYVQHARFVRAVLRRGGVPGSALDDAEQDVFVAAHAGLAGFQGRSGVSTWLFRIAVRVASQLRRKQRRSTGELLVEVPDPSIDPEVAARQREALEIVDRCLRRLDDDKWMVFVMAELDGRPADEIAAALGIPRATVYTRLHRARRQLRRELEQSGQPRPFWAFFGGARLGPSKPVAVMGAASSKAVLTVLALVLVLVAVVAAMRREPSTTTGVVSSSSGATHVVTRARGEARPQRGAVTGDRPTGWGDVRDGSLRGVVRNGGERLDVSAPEIAGATVCVWPQAGPAHDRQSGRTQPICTTTNETGVYELRPLTVGEYRLVASAQGFVPELGGDALTRPLAIVDGGGQHHDVWLQPGGVRIAGTVRDIEGKAIAGAQVLVARGSATSVYVPRDVGQLVRTDDEGRFEATTHPGSTWLWAEADGFAPGRRAAAAPSSGSNLRLLPASTVAGVVVWADDQTPAAGARVTGYRGQDMSAAIADAAGRFAIEAIAPGRWNLYAIDAQGHSRRDVAAVVELGERRDGVRIELERGRPVHGIVKVEANGVDGDVACAGGLIELSSGGDVGNLAVRRRHVAAIAADGRVRVDGVRPGRYAADIRCANAVVTPDAATIEVGERGIAADEAVEWIVGRGVQVSGEVHDVEGKRIADVAVWLIATQAARYARMPVARTDAHGRFVFSGVAPGHYAVQLASTDARDERPVGELDVDDGDIDDLVFVRPRFGRVAGRVEHVDGTPVVGAKVLNLDDSTQTAAFTDDDGQFLLHDTPPGRRHITVMRGSRGIAASDGESLEAAVDVRAGETSRLTLIAENEIATLRGVVRDDLGAVVPGAFVTAVSGDRLDVVTEALRSPMQASQPDAFVLTDRHGRFELTALVDRTHGIRATVADGADGIAIARPGTDAVVTVQRHATLSGTIVTSDGRVPEAFELTSYEPYRTDRFFGRDGTFVLDDVRPGPHTWAVMSSEGSARFDVTSQPGRTDRVEIELVPLASVVGRLVALDGRPIAGAEVRASGVLGGHSYSKSDALRDDLLSDDDGRFALRGVVSGRSSLAVRVPASDASLVHETFIGIEATPGRRVDLGELIVAPRQVAADETAGRIGIYPNVHEGATPADDRFVIDRVVPDTPAHEAGLADGDVVVAIGGHSVVGARAYLGEPLVRVPVGEPVTLTLESGRVVVVRTR